MRNSVLLCIFLAILTENVAARNYDDEDDYDFEGTAYDPVTERDVNVKDCPGGCSVNGRCQDTPDPQDAIDVCELARLS